MISFDCFHNDDPPRLADAWRATDLGPAALQPMTSAALEAAVFSKPYFDRHGLLVARDGDRLLGFAHAAFGPSADRSTLDTSVGTTLLVVVPPHERQAEIEDGLLAASEDHLRSRGATTILGGGSSDLGGFYLGLYGGSDLPGILDSSPRMQAIFRRAGYREVGRIAVLRRTLAGFRPRYRSLEALLAGVEGAWADLGFQVLTSSGTSGRFTILVRDRDATERTVDSFYLSFCRYLGVEGIRRAIFVMPRRTRIAMACMASFSVARLDLPADRIHFAIPFPAEPDQVRIRAGRTFRPGLAGLVEQRLGHPFMDWMQERYVTPRAVRISLDLLRRSEAAGERVLLFAGWVQLHAIVLALHAEGRTLKLAPGSLLGTGGGLKELYPFTPDQIRADVAEAIKGANGSAVPIRDVYGMAEANWAAMQCARGNYHLPPWVYARTLDEDDAVQEGADTTGLLAFFDPYGGGRLFPAFFKTADQVRLVRPDGGRGYSAGGYSAGGGTDLNLACPCGEPGAYIADGSIRRVDLLDEAGCAAQV